jgi:hypothetical protein
MALEIQALVGVRTQTEDYYIYYLLPLVLHSGLKSKSKDWLARNQNKVERYS